MFVYCQFIILFGDAFCLQLYTLLTHICNNFCKKTSFIKLDWISLEHLNYNCYINTINVITINVIEIEFHMRRINNIGKEVMNFFFFLKMGLLHDIKRLSLTLIYKSESLVAKILKFWIDEIWSQKRIWSFTAVDFLDFDSLLVKGKISKCLQTLTFKCRDFWLNR